MTRVAARLFASMAVVAGCVMTPAGGAAQPPDAGAPSRNAMAIEKAQQGRALYDKGEWERALVLFREADALYHSPVLVLYSARAESNRGKLLEAKRLYQALVAESIDPSAHESWKQAQRDGVAELEALELQVPQLTVVMHGATAATLLTMDGVAVAVGVPLELDPGEHRVVVSHQGRQQERIVTLRPGQRSETVVFEPVPPPAPPPVHPPPAPVPLPDPLHPEAQNDSSDDGLPVPGLVLTSIGAATLIAGGIVGAVALSKASEAESKLPLSCDADQNCPAYEEEAIKDAYRSTYTLAHVSDGLLIGGAVIAAVGVVLWIVDPGRGPRSAARTSLRGGSLELRY